MPLIVHIAVLCLVACIILAIAKFILSLLTSMNFLDCLDFADMGGGGGGSCGSSDEGKERERQRQIEIEAYQKYLAELEKLMFSEYLMASALAANEMITHKEQIRAFDESKEKALAAIIKDKAENKEKIYASIDPLAKNLSHTMSTSLEDKGLRDYGLAILIAPELLMIREHRNLHTSLILR